MRLLFFCAKQQTSLVICPDLTSCYSICLVGLPAVTKQGLMPEKTGIECDFQTFVKVDPLAGADLMTRCGQTVRLDTMEAFLRKRSNTCQQALFFSTLQGESD